MPQGRRKVPFSGKAKKLQMQAKKQRQTGFVLAEERKHERDRPEGALPSARKINLQPRAGNCSGNKYALQFVQESKEELLKRKEEARQKITPIPLESQEVSDNFFPPEIDLPKRPPWDFNSSKDVLNVTEHRYFTEYLKGIEKVHGLSYFELNLETWRQLWRVLEMSDVLLVIVDIRYPVLMFPPYLYEYVTKDLGKDMLLVLNKIDLAPAALVVAWREYFRTRYPKLHVLVFTSFPTYNVRGGDGKHRSVGSRRLKGKLKMAAEGALKLLENCERIVGDAVDLSSWRDKIKEEMKSEHSLDELDRENDVVQLGEKDTGFYRHERYKNGVLTIGCIGTPNAGKSSLMNALMGKKVVSVSRTPGHTKHFQTIFLTKTVCLCDCPGLVFPSTVPKQFQILMGSFPIAQAKEPYTTVKFLAERLDLPDILKLQHPENDDSWSAIDICDAWAAKRRYLTARTARFDSYRAANSLLRIALEGKICIYAYPPGWFGENENWEKHPEVETVKWIQAQGRGTAVSTSDEGDSSEQNSEEDEPAQVSADEGQASGGVYKSGESQASSDDDADVPLVVNKFIALATGK